MREFVRRLLGLATLVGLSAAGQGLEGWAASVNLNRTTTSTFFGGAAGETQLGEAAVGMTLQAGRVWSVGGRRILGAGMTLGLTEVASGRSVVGGKALSFRLLEMYSVYVEYGVAADEMTLLYGKLNYLGARGEESYAGDVFSKTYAGLGYGLGVRRRLGQRLYLQAEFLHADYEWKGSRTGAFRPVSTTGGLGLGWQF